MQRTVNSKQIIHKERAKIKPFVVGKAQGAELFVPDEKSMARDPKRNSDPMPWIFRPGAADSNPLVLCPTFPWQTTHHGSTTSTTAEGVTLRVGTTTIFDIGSKYELPGPTPKATR